jgi:hypothetical protein
LGDEIDNVPGGHGFNVLGGHGPNGLGGHSLKVLDQKACTVLVNDKPFGVLLTPSTLGCL